MLDYNKGVGGIVEIYTVKLSTKAQWGLRRVPKHIVDKLIDWVESVAEYGLSEVRKVPGYHDEPLRGKRKGQRSIRLSRAYRAIYMTDESEDIQFLEVIEVNKHEY